MALHTRDGSRPVHVTRPPSGRDVLKWAQMPIADVRHKIVSSWRENLIVNGTLPHNTLWIKHAAFNWDGREFQIETTGEFYFCYE